MNAFTIDAFDFSRVKEQRTGRIAVADLPRLAAECADSIGDLAWSVAGGLHASGHLRLSVTVVGTVHLQCQRCLKPLAFDIDSASTLILTKDEAQADQVEQALDDERLDVIVGDKEMNLRDLVEDEALLAIPQSPRHEQCPGDAAAARSVPQADEESNASRPSPFAVLKDLKH